MNNTHNYPIGDRFEIIEKYIRDKDVLDLGCVDHDFELRGKEHKWLHDFIIENSKMTLGVDFEEKDLIKMKEEGYKVICANVETMELNQKFDVIIAGELIEHLYNAGLFLNSVHKHLRSGGKFILTTPNPFNFRLFIRLLITKNIKVRDDHTCWYCPRTLSHLLVQHNFKIEKIYWINLGPKYSKMNIISHFRRWWSPNFLIIASKR